MRKRNTRGPQQNRKDSSGPSTNRKRSSGPYKKSGSAPRKRSGDDSSEEKKSYSSRSGSDKRPYKSAPRGNSSSDRSKGKSDNPSFERKTRFGKKSDDFGDKKPFSSRDGNKRPRKTGSTTGSRYEKNDSRPSRFSKKEDRDERGGFRNRRDDSDNDKKGFTKRDGDSSFPRKRGSFDKDEKRPFKSREGNTGRFSDSSSSRNASKGFVKRDDKESTGRFSRDNDSGRPDSRNKFKTPDEGKRPRKGAKTFRPTSEQFQDAPQQTEKIRLNRYISNSGVCSRREADELITMGLISVNGKTITEMGYKVNPGDEVRHEGKLLKAERPVYILMNKPKGFLTTTSDPQERNTVMHILANAVKERVYPVGRLDRNTTGLLLLTNDGDLADKLMHPSYNVKKIYKVELDRPLTKADFERLQEGVKLDEGVARIDDVAIISEDKKTVGLELHIGWNRVIRRIFEAMQYEVVKLDRSVYAGLDKKDLPRGHWRFLTREEIVRLKHYK